MNEITLEKVRKCYPTKTVGHATVSLVANSVSVKGHRMFSFLTEYGRIVHAEMLRHRDFSHSVSSSRAIPTDKILNADKQFCPASFGKNTKGMQSVEPLSAEDDVQAARIWRNANLDASFHSKELGKLGVHKQWKNRLIEPHQVILDLISGTEISNFFALRIHDDAQHEIRDVAEAMKYLYDSNEPTLLHKGQSHIPYFQYVKGTLNKKYMSVLNSNNDIYTLEQAIAIGMSLSAQTSYRNLDMSLEKAVVINDKLFGKTPYHVSPSECIASPMDPELYDLRVNAAKNVYAAYSKTLKNLTTEKELIKNFTKSGNLVGFDQFRKAIPNETM